MEILSGPNPSVATSRAKVSETDNSLWYNAGRHQGKLAGAATHWESACWGACSKCGKRGHCTEWCRNDPVSPPDPEQAKAAGEKPKKKKKGKKKAKKMDQTNGAAATVENPVSSGSGSESEGCTYPVASLAVIKELKAKITHLTQDLIIVEASGSELQIPVPAVIYIKAEVLGEDRKKLEVAMIEGLEGSKEVLVSMKLVKAWNVLHQSFLRESVNSYIKRNKLDENCTSYYSIQVSESLPIVEG